MKGQKFRQLLFRGNFWKHVRRQPLPRKLANRIKEKHFTMIWEKMKLIGDIENNYMGLEQMKTGEHPTETELAVQRQVEQTITEKEKRLKELEKKMERIKKERNLIEAKLRRGLIK